MSWPADRRAVGNRRRIGLLTGLVLAATIGSATPASAHTLFQSSDPADGAELAASPASIRLSFSGPIARELAALTLTGEDGREIALGPIAVDPASGDLVATVPALATGIYQLRWRVASPLDLHEATGTIAFGVGRAPPATSRGSQDAQVSLGASVFRALELLGFAILAGAITVTLVAARIGAPGRAPVPGRVAWVAIARRLRRLAAIGAIVAVLAGAGRVGAAVLALPGPASVAPIAGYLSAWLVGVGAIAALAAGTVLIRPERWRAWLAATAAVGSIGAGAIVQPGHLTVHGLPGIALAAVHLLAAAVWIGGVVALAVLVPLAAPSGGGSRAVKAVARDFGPIALAAAASLATSGLMAAGAVLPAAAALLGPFGAVLLVKLLLAAGVALLGLRNSTAVGGRALIVPDEVRPRLQALLGLPRRPPALRRLLPWLRAEALVGVAVMAAAGILIATPPVAPGDRGTPVVAAGSGQADDLVVAVAVRPLRPGPNFVSALVLDTRRPAPGPITAVDVVLAGGGSGPQAYPAVASDGQWVAVVPVGAAGRWSTEIVVHRAGLPDARTSVAWDLPTPVGPGLQRPLFGPALAAAIALILVGAGAALALRSGALGRALARSRRLDARPGGLV